MSWNKNRGFANIKTHFSGDLTPNVFGMISQNNARKEIKMHNNRLVNLIKIFLIYNENPSGLFSCYNWVSSQNKTKKYENVFIQVLRNMFGNHKVKIN